MFPRIPLPGLPFGLPTYGLLVAVGFLAALWLAERLGRRHGFGPHVVQDVAVWACLWGLVGAKVALVIVERPPLREIWQTLFQGGVFYGGFLGAVAGVLWRCRAARINVHALGDVLAAPLALGHAFGRIGCFLAGCCYGAPCTAPWAVHYTSPASMPVLAGVPPFLGLHPVQLYEAFGNFALAGLCLLLLAHRRFEGQVAWSYVAAYGTFRVIIEHWRGDERGTVGAISTSQAIGLAMIAVGLGVLAWRARASRRVPAPGETSAPPMPPA